MTGERTQKISTQRQLVKVLQNGDTDGFKAILISLFSSIANNNYTRNNIGDYEDYYASVLYAYLVSLGFQVIPEDVTNKGRIDLSLLLPDKVYIFEFKVVQQATNTALQQIKTKQYYQKYQAGKQIYLIGIEFGKVERNIVTWKVEKQ